MTIQKFINQISCVLNRLKIDYIISGGVAVTVWGKPRYTADIGIVIELDSVESVRNLIYDLKKTFPKSYSDEDVAIDAFKRKSEFNVVEPEYGIKIDFFISDKTEYKKLAMKRGKLKKLDDKMICFISPEDLIISKLIWFKEGQSTRQLEDILSVIEVQKKLDKTYLDSWINKLGLQGEWQKLEELKSK